VVTLYLLVTLYLTVDILEADDQASTNLKEFLQSQVINLQQRYLNYNKI
jgi:hypothetical protein